MNKQEFLNALDRKLQVINEKERKDIIDEYRTHIEMKMQEGKSEEEAIEDFGNIDELVDDILDAYKINRNQKNTEFDAKVNHFMDELYEGFKRFIGSFTSLEVDDVVRLIFEILIVLVLLAVLRIPFEIISSLGSSLLNSVMGFGVGSLLATIWRIIINLVYIVVFVVIIVNIVSKRVHRYRSNVNDGKSVFDDFKDSMQDMTNKKHKSQTIYDDQEDMTYSQKDEQPYEANSNDEEKDDTSYSYRNDRQENEYRKNPYQEQSISRGVSSVASILMKAFFCLLLIPFIAMIVGLCCALGAMVVLSLQGLTLFSAYFIVIGGLVVTGAFVSAIYRSLWRRR